MVFVVPPDRGWLLRGGRGRKGNNPTNKKKVLHEEEVRGASASLQAAVLAEQLARRPRPLRHLSIAVSTGGSRTSDFSRARFRKVDLPSPLPPRFLIPDRSTATEEQQSGRQAAGAQFSCASFAMDAPTRLLCCCQAAEWNDTDRVGSLLIIDQHMRHSKSCAPDLRGKFCSVMCA